MTQVKRIVCLANSRKLAGRCIAGREWASGNGGKWIRPVSSRTTQEVSEYERQYDDGSDPKVLDIIDVPLIEPQPYGIQRENWLLDPTYYWTKAGTCSPFQLEPFADPIERLWIDGNSTYHGSNDRILLDSMGGISSSLRFIRSEYLLLKVFAPGEAFGNAKRRVQGRFNHAGRDYALWVTDPVYERRFLSKLDGDYRIDQCYLTISLGEEYDKAVYKLIAGIIELDGT